MGFKFIKKLIGSDKLLEKESISSYDKLILYKEFHGFLRRFFSNELLIHIQPKAFNDGILYVECAYDFMEELNEYSTYIASELDKNSKNFHIRDVHVSIG